MLLPAVLDSAQLCRLAACAVSERAPSRVQDEEDEREASLEKEKFEAVKAKVIVLLFWGTSSCVPHPLLGRG